MARYLISALDGLTSKEGDEESCNRWDADVYMPDLKSVKRVNAGRRYDVLRAAAGSKAGSYVTAVETDDMAAASRGLFQAPFDPMIERSRSAYLPTIRVGGEAVAGA